MQTFGIDIGGSGIKGAPVDLATGKLAAERLRLKTPEPATPDACGDVMAEIIRQAGWSGPVGCTFPGVMKENVVFTAANMDDGWIGVDLNRLLLDKANCPAVALNDADAAGLAEMEMGAGRGQGGVVIMLTFGTGIGTAIFTNGCLVPNVELGHMEVRGKEGEWRASDAARKRDDLSWEKWAERVNEYLGRLDAYFWPDLIIIGGGVSNKAERFMPLLESRARVALAKLRNEAGIIGGAMAARCLLD